MTQEIHTDADGQVVGFGYHDGSIAGILFAAGSLIRLEVLAVDGSATTLVVDGVERLLINNLREGNIIDRIFCWPIDQMPAWMEPRVEALLGRGVRTAAPLRVVHLQCSYGAEMIAVISGSMTIAATN